MSSPIRWGDSDSSDEEAYVPSKSQVQDDINFDDHHRPDAGVPPSDSSLPVTKHRGSIRNSTDNSMDHSKIARGGFQKGRGRGGRDDFRGSLKDNGGRSRGRGGGRNDASNWRQMAKAQSRYSHQGK